MDKQPDEQNISILNAELKNIETGECILKGRKKLIELEIAKRNEDEMRAIIIQLNPNKSILQLDEIPIDTLLQAQKEDIDETQDLNTNIPLKRIRAIR